MIAATSAPPNDRPLRVFRPGRSFKLTAMYSVAALIGLGLLAVGLRMAYECYEWLIVERADAPQWFVAAIVMPAFLALGALALAVAYNVIFRPESLFAAVYPDRLRYGDGFKIRELPLSEVDEVVHEAAEDGAVRVHVYLISGKRRDIFAAVLLGEQERNEFIELVNQLAAERRR